MEQTARLGNIRFLAKFGARLAVAEPPRPRSLAPLSVAGSQGNQTPSLIAADEAATVPAVLRTTRRRSRCIRFYNSAHLSFLGQVNPIKYNTIFSGLSKLVKEEGASSLWRGWGGKLFGYGAQGGCKFGLYEYFKKQYSDLLVGSNKSTVYFLSSASAQIIADVALCPFESVKVRVQTQPMFAKGLIDGFPRVYAAEGLSGFYRGLLPLWGRNLPFSMLMFSTFEHTVGFLYQNVIQKKKEDCSTAQQLGATCLAGYISGAVGTVVSNPADNIVSSLYNKKAKSVIHAVKSIGVRGLFTRSLPIRITLVGPVVTMQWFFYDSIKIFTGLPPSGGLPREQEEANK